LFESLEQGDLRVELKLIVLFQVVFVLKSFYSVPREEIATGILGILKYKGIIVKEKKIVRQTIELWHDSKLDIVDCCLIACLEEDRQNILYSYDRDFDKFKINRKEP
jgi:predicted nucleic-acid-binding protein